MTQYPVKQKKLGVRLLLIGSALEWFDYFIYLALTPILAQVFFPNHEQNSAYLLVFLIFAVGFISRLAGGWLFSYIADAYTKRVAFQSSLLLMFIPAFCIAGLPSYDTTGLIAPVLLLFCRLIQGLSVGGEYPVNLMLLGDQCSSAHQKERLLSMTNMMSVVGSAFATSLVVLFNILFTAEQMRQYGWRALFVVSAGAALLNYFLRKKRAFVMDQSSFKKTYWRRLQSLCKDKAFHLACVFFVIATAAIAFYTYNAYALVMLKPFDFLTDTMKTAINVAVSLILLCFMAMNTFWMNKRVAMRLLFKSGLMLYTISIISFALMCYWCGYLLQLLAFAVLLYSVSLILSGLPIFLHRVVCPVAPVSSISLPYNLALTVFGGSAPLIQTYLATLTHSPLAPVAYLFIVAMISLIALHAIDKQTIDNAATERGMIYEH